MIIHSPLSVQALKKNFILNLNNYRNTHFHILNRAKKNYKSVMSRQILALPKMEKISITFTLYPKTKRITDISNVCSIHDKFFCDALVELGRIEDDNYKYIIETSYRFGSVDKENPRCEIFIMELSETYTDVINEESGKTYNELSN